MPLSAAALRPWARIVISALAADIRPSLTTHAVTGTAPDVRGAPAPTGSPCAGLSCCPSLTFTSSSPCPTNSLRSCCRTNGCFTICSSEPARRRCSNLPAIQSIWEQRSGFSACSTLGDRTFSIIPAYIYIVPAGGLTPDGSRWIASSNRFFLPVGALSRVFRGKFTAGLKQLLRQHKLQFHGSLQSLAEPRCFRNFLRQLFHQDWVVYAKPPFGGREHVLNYLARYTHRVAISNHRLVAFQNDRVSFLWKDYAHGGKQKIMTVSTDEFLRRFLIHVLPKGLVRIRHFGLFANRRRGDALARCRSLLDVTSCGNREPPCQLRCPLCGGPMLILERLTCSQLYFRSCPMWRDSKRYAVDTS
jgi:Putative transposase